MIYHHKAKRAQKILHTLQKEAKQYGLHINERKTTRISMNSTKRINTLAGTHIPAQDRVKYLGVILDKKSASEPELNERVKQTMTVWKIRPTMEI